MKYSELTQYTTKYSLNVRIKVSLYILFSVFISFLIPNNLYAQGLTTFTPGAYIIDMGVDTNNVSIANGLKPYGLVYDLILNHNVQISWIINASKSKDGTDFTVNGTDYKGGPFIIASEYVTAAVSAAISSWESKGVQVDYISSAFDAPVFHQLSSWPRAVLDEVYGYLITSFYENAGIPEDSYITAGNPTLITSCEDIYVLPHAKPSEWDQNYIDSLKVFIERDKGNLWSGCKSVSQLENLPGCNFLSDSGLHPSTDHDYDYNENIPYDYSFSGDPIMQFIGRLDEATNKGSEVIYIPNTDWRSSTSKAVFDSDHNTYPGLATIVAYGPAFGNSDYGMIMYEAGHNLDDDLWGVGLTQIVPERAKVAAQRAFFNFILLTGIDKEIEASAIIPDTVYSGISENLTGIASGGVAPYTFEWSVNSSGTLANQIDTDDATAVDYTPPCDASQEVITLKVTDNCDVGRFSIVSKLVYIVQTATPTGDTIQTFCEGPTVADLEPFITDSTEIKWYDVATGGVPLAETDALVDQYYYASQTLNGCDSPVRLAVRVYINYVTGGAIGDDQVACFIADFDPFIEIEASTGSGTLSYQWYSAGNDIDSPPATFTKIPFGGTGTTYSPLFVTSFYNFYKRETTSVLNTVSCTAESNIVSISADIEPPIWIDTVNDLTFECDEILSIDTPRASDNNDIAPTITYSDVSTQTSNGSCTDNSYIITRTWEAIDACNNAAEDQVQTITVADTTSPTASILDSLTFNCISDVPYPDIELVTDEADNCTVNPLVSFLYDVSDNNSCPETITRTYSVTDDCSNELLVTQTITVNDTTKPTASNPATLNVECIDELPLADIEVVTDEADNCTATPLVAFVSDVSDNNSCPETITRTYSVTDDCLNQILVTQTITVNDLTNPTASNPVPISVECIGDIFLADIEVVTDEADNCTTNPVVAFVSDVSDNNSCPETITRTYSITDDCLNQLLVTQIITIDDTTSPTASNPSPINVQCFDDISAADLEVVIDEADNCTANPIVAFVSDVSDNNTCPETITRTYSVTDDCLNELLVTQTITVNDTTRPTASNPAPINVQCFDDISAADIEAVTDEADNCTANPLVAFVSDLSDNNSCPETITRTYSVTDDCSNELFVTQIITINDTTRPTASNPAPVNVECITEVPAADIEVVTDEADNCTVTPLVEFVSDTPSGLSCPMTIVRIYRISDDCGNFTDVTQNIFVADNTLPTASNPAPLNVECRSEVPVDIEAVTDEADNCTANPIVAFVSDVSDNNSCPETITRTYSVTDDCSNQLLVTQIITIDDTTIPTASNPPPINVQCFDDIPTADIESVSDEADNCTSNPIVAFVSDVSDNNSCPETITRTYSITDDCLNQLLVTQIITIDDTTRPTASNPAPINFQCIGDIPISDIEVVSDEADNCTANPIVAFVSDISDNNSCPETITRTYSITDDCLNQLLVTQIITIDDTTRPTASNPPPINVECFDDIPATDIEVVSDEADNCTANPLVAFVSDISDNNSCPEIITRTYSITDDCLNQLLVTQIITIDDTTKPTASNPPPINVQCFDDIPAADIEAVTDEVDNCTANPIVAFVSDVSDNNGCPETITRTFSVTDDCLNQLLVTQIITVNDTTKPTASNPAPINVECSSEALIDIEVVTDEADNCTATPIVAFVSDVSDNNTCPETITRTYSITDDCLNQLLVTQIITIDDTTRPTASNPAPINVQCFGDIPLSDIEVVIDEADNCAATPLVAFVSDVSDNNSCPETITRTYSVTDDCLNQLLVTQIITIDDTTRPTASNPAPINVQCIGDIPISDIEVVSDEADNCATNPLVAFVSDLSDNNTCPETITRTYSITDDCLNQLLVTQIITIDDTTRPTASNPAPITVECINEVPLVDVEVVTDESDNCTISPIVTFVSDVSSGLSCPLTIVRTYRVSDDCGNFIDVSQDIMVTDETPPTASNPPPISVQCFDDIPAADIEVVTDEADNCTTNPIVAFVSDVSDNNSCPETITRTYSVTDDCLNELLVTQFITVNDTTKPTASNPAPINVQCIGDIPLSDIEVVIDEADNCTANPIVAFVSDVSDNNSCLETITRTYSVTDDCLNELLVTQIITVNDTTRPTASNPAPINVQCFDDIPATDIEVVTDEADNCTANPIVAFVTDASDNSSCPETITRTYSITDDCLNQLLVTQIITIDDTTRPTASNPAPINIQCFGDIPLSDIEVVSDEADNCTANPLVAFVSDVSDNNTCPETITRTYSITDDCLNQLLVTQIITIDDTIRPTASNLAPINVECFDDIPAADIVLVSDEADNCTANPIVAFVSDVSDNNGCPKTITRTYSVTDDCLNQLLVTQIITVNDTTKPTASNPAPINVECSSEALIDIEVVTDEADNCTATPLVAFVSDVSDNNTCPETITRTYSITDDCLNQLLVTQIITVNDTTRPTASNPAPINVQCFDGIPTADIEAVTDEADNCTANPLVAFVSDVSDNNSCPETITRTYSITDDCLNQLLVTHIITISDTTRPTASNPPPINVQCSDDIPAADIEEVSGEADNCTSNPIVAFVSDVSDNNSCPETITRTYSVTDDCLNQLLVTQIITISDTTRPTASDPAPITVECINEVPPANIEVVTDEADNCTISPIVTFVGDVPSGLSCPLTIVRTYRVSDDCGNFIDVNQDIMVTDETPPTASNPAPISVQCFDDIPAADLEVVTDEADNCTTNPIVAFVSDVSDNNSCPETITRTYSVTDDCINQLLVTQIITINDTTKPTASNPAPITVDCSSEAPIDIEVVTDETDNCTLSPIVAFVSDVSDNNSCLETITRTYSVTDDCLNELLVTQIITVNDTTKPTASNPAPINVQCIDDIHTTDIEVVIDEADNCTANPIVAFVSDVSDNNTCPETITRTYSITDDCLNELLVTQIITIDDTTRPTASNPAPINVQCVGDIPISDIEVVSDEADNCTANPLIAFVTDVSDNNSCPETITRTYSVTDDCLNQLLVTQLIIVNDTTKPSASNPAPINVQCFDDIPAADIELVSDEADNCTSNPIVAFVSDVSDNNSCPETITRTYSITDDCLNQLLVTQIITVNDTTRPTASTPAPIAADCSSEALIDIEVVTDEADNCTATPIVAFVSDVSDNNTCPETITRTYSITDDCLNQLLVTQIITIDDTTRPTASNPAPINFQCFDDISTADIEVVIDEVDNCTANPLVAFVSDVSDNNTCPETITRTYSVTDDCLNQILVTQTITINDITNPSASNLPDITVQCYDEVPIPDIGSIPNVQDNCSSNPLIEFVSDIPDALMCPLTIVRTYRISDDCGNSITVTQNIFVADDTAPTASNLQTVNLECNLDIPLPDINLITDETDNCAADPIVEFIDDVSDGFACPETVTRTYRVSDGCGNFLDVYQIFVINDISPPTASNPVDWNIQCNDEIPIDIEVVIDENDNCTLTPKVEFISDVIDGLSCPETITRTYRVSDDCGNYIDVYQTIIVLDTTPPIASTPEPIYLECIEDVPQPDIYIINDATDNCSDIITIDFEGEDQFSFGTGLIRTLERHYSLTDICGNKRIITHYIYINGLPHAEDDYYTIDENSTNNIFKVLINDDYGCDGYGTINIQIANLPMYGVAVPNNNNSPFDLSDDYIIYTPIRNNYFSDSFEYAITDKSGDISIANVDINFIPNPLNIPEAFSPDGDGINDLFHIRGLFFYPNNSIIIFNQKGNTIFEANPYLNDWNGTNMFTGEVLLRDTYFYLFDKGDGSIKMKGFIYLLPK